MTNTLYRKYRPQTFGEIVGQQHIVKTLTNALKHDRLAQAYLFTGPRGTGKTTTARLLAKAATCLNRKSNESDPSRESLAEADLSRQSLAEADLSRQSLAEADLSRQSLAEADLSRQSLAEADLSRQSLAEADLSRQSLAEADLSRQSLAEADLSRQSLAEAEPCLKCAHCQAMAENTSMDIIEIDAASNTGVDNIRELRETVKFPPTLAPKKVYIIDEVHMLSAGAFNALLKTLEEPPKHVIFILATTALHKVPDTILSRCQRFDFSRFPVQEIVEKLSAIAKTEKVTVEPAALEMIALAAEGGMRDAESLFAQVIALEDKNITSEEVSAILGITSQQNVEQLVHHLADRNLAQSLDHINSLAEGGVDLFVFSDSLLQYLRHGLLLSIDQNLSRDISFTMTSEQVKTLQNFSTKLTTSGILTLLELFQTARKDIRSATLPQLPLEIAVVKFLSGHTNTPASTPPAKPNVPQDTTATQPKTKNTNTPHPTVVKDTLVVKENQATYTASNSPEPIQEEASQKSTTEALSLGNIQLHWQAITNTAKEQNASLALALSNCQPLNVEGSIVTLGVKFPFHKEKLSVAENRLTVESAFDTILGVKTKVQIVVDESVSAPPQRNDIPNNPVLAQALDILGGQVVG